MTAASAWRAALITAAGYYSVLTASVFELHWVLAYALGRGCGSLTPGARYPAGRTRGRCGVRLFALLGAVIARAMVPRRVMTAVLDEASPVAEAALRPGH
jgi:hypothetical protein